MKTAITLMVSLFIPTLTFSAPLEVYPTSLQKLPSQELGQVILKFIPSTSSEITWFERANDESIIWINRTFVEESLGGGVFYSSRKGVFRGHVNGVKSTYLYNNLKEMPWLVILEGEIAKFGVTSVTFKPSVVLLGNKDEEGDCFGTTHENCEFSPFISLKKAGIKYQKICEAKYSGNNFRNVYLLTKKGKKNTYGIWENSDGSGGGSSVFSLDYSHNQKEVCKKIQF